MSHIVTLKQFKSFFADGKHDEISKGWLQSSLTEERLINMIAKVLEIVSSLGGDGKCPLELTQLSVFEMDKTDDFLDDDMVIILSNIETGYVINLICLSYETTESFFAILTSDNDCDPDYPALETPDLSEVITWLNTPFQIVVC